MWTTRHRSALADAHDVGVRDLQEVIGDDVGGGVEPVVRYLVEDLSLEPDSPEDRSNADNLSVVTMVRTSPST